MTLASAASRYGRVSSEAVDQLQADADYYRDRVALLRAKLYRWGLGRDARLEALERELEQVEQLLHEARSRTPR